MREGRHEREKMGRKLKGGEMVGRDEKGVRKGKGWERDGEERGEGGEEGRREGGEGGMQGGAGMEREG